MTRFQECLRFILGREGGYVDDPSDRGGATNQGVTDRTYQSWRKDKGLPPQPVKFMTNEERDGIYFDYYWKPAKCDRLPVPVDIVMFDAWVQHRPTVAAKFLQQAVGVTMDGMIGPGTMGAVEREIPDTLALTIIKARKAFYKRLAEQDITQIRFLDGWNNRMDALRKEVM